MLELDQNCAANAQRPLLADYGLSLPSADRPDVLAGKRALNLRQVKALAERFGLSMDALA